MTTDQYQTCNEAWKATNTGWLHARLTPAEAERMARTLWQSVGEITYHRVAVRPVWLREGVRRLVHDVSHRIWRVKRPAGERRNHCPAHAAWELACTNEAIKRGWHLPKKPRAPRVVVAKPAPDPVLIEQARIAARLKSWRTKAKRAATAIKKLERRAKHVERKRANAVTATVSTQTDAPSASGLRLTARGGDEALRVYY